MESLRNQCKILSCKKVISTCIVFLTENIGIPVQVSSENGLVLHSNSIELQHVQISFTLKAKTDFYNTIVEETHDLQIQT